MELSFKSFLNNLDYQKVFFSSGYRNSSLLRFFDQSKVSHGFLDQSLAFQALGVAKITNMPCIVCVTSGSAVAQMLPALMEAFYTHEKLIIISADRPRELIGSGAPQMVDQWDLLAKYTRSSYSGTLEDFDSKNLQEFPMHINIEINELLLIKDPQVMGDETLFILNKFDQLYKDIDLKNMLDESNFCVYQEVESPFYSHTFPHEILYEKELETEWSRFKTVIRVGQTPNSKMWRLWDQTDSEIYHLIQNEFKGMNNGVVLKDPKVFLKNLFHKNCASVKNKQIDLASILKNFPHSEVSRFRKLMIDLDRHNSIFFVGNSMPIRNLKFFKPQNARVIANRGVNGIDGLISTAIGIALGSPDYEVSAFIGDLSYFYDQSILHFSLPSNLKIYVFNNNGGRIFDRINGPKEIINEHNLSIDSQCSQVVEITVDNEQTEAFWSCFNELLKK